MKKRSVVFSLFIGLCSFESLLCANTEDAYSQATAEDKCYQQGEELGPNYSAAYNAPGAIAVAHTYSSNLSFFLDAAFTYWYISEEGLKIATNGVLESPTLSYSTNTQSYFPDFNYKPGFKVGIGAITSDEWEYRADYTWVHATVNANGISGNPGGNLPAGTTTVTAGVPVFVVDDWFLQGSGSGQALAASSISALWKLSMNLVNLTAGRPWYQAKTLIISPLGGLQLAFIDQKMNVYLTEATGQLTSLSSQPISSLNSSKSWGVGFVAGGKCKALLPKDFYLDGCGSLGILYTTYTSINHSEDSASTAFNPGPYKASYTNYHAIRPNANLDMGLGWARYLQNNTAYIDFKASYQFSVYWAQNMMRKLLDDIVTGASPAPGDLFTQGLSLSATIHF